MAEYIARLKETACPELVEAASQTLKVQITATCLYRYRLEGMGYALSHNKESSVPSQTKSISLWNHDT